MKTFAMLGMIFVACSGSSGPPASAGGSGGAAAVDAGAAGAGGSAPADAMVIGAQDAAAPDASPADAAPGPTWDSFARAFFVKYCGACHNDDNAGDPTRDYHMLAVVMNEKAEIACGVSRSQADWARRGCTGFPPARQFPVGNGVKPTDEERDQLVQWIDSGTP